MMPKRKTPPLSFAAYQRLHNVIYSLSKKFAHGPERSCVFFSITGAALMHKHYQLDAKVVCGGGAVLLDKKTETALSWFVKRPDGTITTGAEGFHAWISCEDWLIDLTAPNYHEAVIGATFQNPTNERQSIPALKVPRMMMQKLISETERELDEMHKSGDCAFYPDSDITKDVIDNAFEQVQLGDVINIAYNWHRPVPQKMEPSITIGDNYGEIQTVHLIKRELVGKW
ncbi:DUF2026 family protein [Janthinobacterium lividum]|uniref:DUF2026 family protein n=1 Tax=Janthinobacterium lividum TaxID=29581 RepID=UPI00089304B5|nr:DUF2026 family protein [Janthinobacterium lividum]MCC7716202.1 DUF2026 family protein [Janthinobacterium lividum]OEZ53087.1 hypothetical protein JANLI_44930 [Janthinobacterium lividum]WQE28864.1 DUF2026 family protein [Janthinobacterium lividum]STQ94325.1 Protein of uncharacterised function (DUF2026) [Janthinobacterium lividum]